MEYGFSKEKMVYIVREGKSGADEIKHRITSYNVCYTKLLRLQY